MRVAMTQHRQQSRVQCGDRKQKKYNEHKTMPIMIVLPWKRRVIGICRWFDDTRRCSLKLFFVRTRSHRQRTLLTESRFANDTRQSVIYMNYKIKQERVSKRFVISSRCKINWLAVVTAHRVLGSTVMSAIHLLVYSILSIGYNEERSFDIYAHLFRPIINSERWFTYLFITNAFTINK